MTTCTEHFLLVVNSDDTRTATRLANAWGHVAVSDLIFLGPLSVPIRYYPLTGPEAPPVCELSPTKGWLGLNIAPPSDSIYYLLEVSPPPPG